MSGFLHRGIGGPSRCRSCQVVILFAKHSTTGKLMPFQRDDAKGEWSVANGVATHVGKAPSAAIVGVEPIPRYTSHFAHCPKASEWRR